MGKVIFHPGAGGEKSTYQIHLTKHDKTSGGYQNAKSTPFVAQNWHFRKLAREHRTGEPLYLGGGV